MKTFNIDSNESTFYSRPFNCVVVCVRLKFSPLYLYFVIFCKFANMSGLGVIHMIKCFFWEYLQFFQDGWNTWATFLYRYYNRCMFLHILETLQVINVKNKIGWLVSKLKFQVMLTQFTHLKGWFSMPFNFKFELRKFPVLITSCLHLAALSIMTNHNCYMCFW
jgi:hypothetical protein